MSRRFRVTAWIILVALAAFQAYAQRYAISPDGISYLDLSDAAVSGRLGGLVNLYWSPLYPLLVGIARAIFGAGAQHEIAIIHGVNVACFAVMLAAFEYLIIPILERAQSRRGAVLGGRWGGLAAYALFGCLSFTMTPLELTTPDWLSNAAIFLALGALVRLREPNPRETRAAIVLGLALGIGALAKSFLVPWGLVCFACLLVLRRRTGVRPLVVAAAAWLVVIGPWSAVLSARAHRFTFGDAGRLTYGWYVNGVDTPSLGVVPSGARRASTDALLPGVGVTGPAEGADPMWFDPARWSTLLHPHFSLHDQLTTLETMGVTLIGNLSVLAFALLLVVAAPRGSRRPAWRDGWMVFVPAVAGMIAYCMVILTSRYIMAFALAAVLMLLAVLPIPRRVRPVLLLAGMAVTIGVQAVSPATTYGLSFVTACAAAMYVGSAIPLRRRGSWFFGVTLTVLVSVLIFTPNVPALLRIVAVVIVLALWARSRGAVHTATAVTFARGMFAGLAYAVTLIFAGRVLLRVARDVSAASVAASGDPQWRIAQDLAQHGVTPGTRVAVIGPHAESYWARTARVQIVANVPNPLTPMWWMMPDQRREQLLAEFARAGAQVAIATRLPANATGAPANWTPLRYHGWLRRLAPPRPLSSPAR